MPGLVDLVIESLDVAGDGVARHGGRAVSVPFTIPGERVRVRIVRGGAGGWRTELVEVLRPSPHRIAARCRHFGPCGGCAWQHIAYPEQLRLKAAVVERLVRSAVPSAPRTRPTLPGAPVDSPWGYRQKVHFVFGPPDTGRPEGQARRVAWADDGAAGGESFTMGHYARGSRRVVAVRECPVHDERGNALAFGLRGRLLRAGVGAADRPNRPGAGRTGPPAGTLRSLAIRAAVRTGELLATLVVNGDGDRRLRTATKAFLASGHGATAFHLNFHPREDGFIFGEQTRRLGGTPRLREEVGGVSYLISPTSFFQTNVHAAGLLVGLVLDAVGGAASVIDLYAGAGLFAIPLARAGRQVVAVEGNRSAVEDARASLRLNGIPDGRCRILARDVERVLADLSPAEAVVLDPPRDGCGAGVMTGVFGRLRPATAAYVSCNPESLARDLTEAAVHGYRIESIQPVDMFPHTAHVETVVVLRRPRRRRRERVHTEERSNGDERRKARF